jgi:iduronate 2-sulfatase
MSRIDVPPFSRRSFLGVGLGALAAPLVAAPRKPRNVLFIASDDLNTSLGCYGHPLVRTPNIDRIARQGVRFDRAYCQYSLCSPSRSSLMTGMAPDTTAVYDLQKHFRETLPDVVTLPQLFQKNGYFTARSGKIYHYGVPGQIGTSGLDDAPSWNQVVNPNGVDHTKEEALLTHLTPQRKGLGSTVAYYASPEPDEKHTDGITADAIVQMMEEHRKEPFFLGAGFYRPHCPYIAPAKYFDRIPLDRIELVPFDESEMTMAPPWAYFNRDAMMGMTPAQRREGMRAYFATIAFMDAQVGKLLGALDRLKLADDTVIVFWGDNGYQLGEHGQWMKQTNFEAAARIPLVMSAPGIRGRGRGCGRTVELLDIYPTLAEVCGMEHTPPNLQGRSLAPLLENPNAPWDRPALSQMQRRPQGRSVMGYSMRTERYRYTEWEFGAEGAELYDYEKDPREVHNLAADPASESLRTQLRTQLRAAIAARGAKAPA